MKLQLFIEKDLAVHFYYSEESLVNDAASVKNLCVVFHGLPNFIDKDFFEDKITKDTAFLSVYYYGTWLSGGKFTPESVKQTIQDALMFAQKKEGVKTFDNKKLYWDYERLFVLGYSFAGNSIVTAPLVRNDIASVLLYAPLIYLNKDDVELVLKDEAEKFFDFNNFFLKFLQRGYLHALRGVDDVSWDNYFDGKDISSHVAIFKEYPPIHIFHGCDDKQVNPAFSEFFCSQHRDVATLELQKGIGHTKEMFTNKHLEI